MTHNGRMIGAVLGVLLCAAGGAARQTSTPTGKAQALIGKPKAANGNAPAPAGRIVGMRPVPVTPELEAKLDEEDSLDQAAAAAMIAGQYTVAEADARQSISVGPDSGLAQELLAAALDAQGKTLEALQAYKIMVDQGDVFPRNLLPYALLLLDTGQWARAAAAYNKALPYLAYGDLMRESGDFSITEPQPRDLATAIHIALGLTDDWRGYSWTLHSKDQILTQFHQALALEPNSELANYYYANALQRLGRAAQARAVFQKTAKMATGDVKAAAEQALK